MHTVGDSPDCVDCLNLNASNLRGYNRLGVVIVG
jgi:hypothetical protein